MYKWREKRMRHLFGREAGFTLVEILIVIAVLGILAAIAIPVYNAQRDKSDDAVLKSNIIAAMTNIEQSKAAFGGKYPATLTSSSGTPIAAPNTEGVTFKYSIPYDRANYCLQATYEGKSLFVTRTSPAPSTTDCTYTFVIPAPENFFASVDLSMVPKARWDLVEGATAYNVYKDGTKVGTYSTNTAALPAMNPGTTGTYWVRAVTSGGMETSDSNKMTITAPVPAPSTAPTLTFAQTADNGTAMTTTNKLSWTAVTWATSYLLYDADTDQLLNPGNGSASTFDVTVEKNETKRFYVIASNATGNGPKSNIVTIAPKFIAPVLASSIDDFTLNASHNWQTMASNWGTGATAVVKATDGSFTSPSMTTNTYSRKHTDRLTKSWTVTITTGNGVVLVSNAVQLAPKGIPTIDTVHQRYWQNLDSTLGNTPSYYGLTASNSKWRVDVSNSSTFSKIYPQTSETGTDPADTFSGKTAPTHGGTYYLRYVITRTSDGAELSSATETILIPTRSLDASNNGARDILALYTWNGDSRIFKIPTRANGQGMLPANSVVDPRIIGQDCTVLPVMDFKGPGTQGFLCWRHNTNINGYPGSLDYYAIDTDTGAIGAPLLIGNGWNMYEKVAWVQNFYGDDYPSLIAARPDGGLEVWRGGPNGLVSVDRSAGSGWHIGGSDTAAFKGIYDWNGYGSVGVMATTRYSPYQRYYPSIKNPTAQQQLTSYVNLNASWNAAATPSGYFPTDSNPNGCCSYVYSREYGNMELNGKVVPVVGFGPKTYYDAFYGNGAGGFGGAAMNWGYPNEGYMGYPGEWKTIR